MAREEEGPPRDLAERRARRQAQRLAKAAGKVEAASAKVARSAAQVEQLGEHLAALDLWTRPDPGTRRPRFSRDEIARVALHIADTEGFDALSMRRIAAALGAGTMTLYYYVRTKDELLALIRDAVMAELLVPEEELADDWRTAITQIAVRSRDALRRHPWSLDIREDHGPSPNATRHFDQCVRALQGLDVPLGDKFELITAVDEYVFGFCFFEQTGVDDVAADAGGIAAYLEALMATGDYPALAALAADHGVAGPLEVMRRRFADPDRFHRNLTRLLDGFAASFGVA